jgi:hypothetical protein
MPGKRLQQAESAFFTQARPTSLLQRFIEPAEVATMVIYVCIKRASATTASRCASKAAWCAA